MAKAFLRSFVAMRGWESAVERRIETEIWNNEKESELWDEIEESEDLKFEFDSSHMFGEGVKKMIGNQTCETEEERDVT
jgi:hypothetical protein